VQAELGDAKRRQNPAGSEALPDVAPEVLAEGLLADDRVDAVLRPVERLFGGVDR
jgi:hypothetical protein